MKISVIFLLLLLVCSISTDQNMTQAGDTNPALQLANYQPGLQNIRALLRELTVSLAEQKVKITFLQTENQEQAAKLQWQKTELGSQKTELGSQKTELGRQKTELGSQKTELGRQKTELGRQKTELGSQKIELGRQKTELGSQKIELGRQKTELGSQKTEVDKLKQHLQVQQVAFSASLVTSGSLTRGPFPALTTLIFKHVVTNIGNAYNPNTGVFTPPVRGAYHFEWYIVAPGHNHYPTSVVLVKNSEHIFTAWEHQTSGYGSSSNGATLLLEVGDVVFLRQWQNTKVFDSTNHHTTFSGHLIFTM